MATAARRVAFRLLRELDRGGATLADLLSQPEAERLSPRDRAFLHELVLGTLRHRGTLDHALAAHVDRPLGELDPAVLVALRLGASQLLRMRVPARAAVSESVDLAREHAPRASGLVNAVLRRLAREGPPPALDSRADPLGWLTSTGSLPGWLAQRWLARLGPEGAIARTRALLEPPVTAFRLNPRVPGALQRVKDSALQIRPLSVPGAWAATGGRAADLATEGLIYMQDEASQMVAHLAAVPGRVLDACAAPGGKATLIADLHSADARVVAAEASTRRLRTLARIVNRWGAGNVAVVGADALRPPFRGRFDSVLLDAPCSGLGTLARHPDIRWRLEPAEILRHSLRQRQMIESLAPLVAAGGKLVYSACSSEPEEGEDVVLPFLEAHPEFSPETLPAWASRFAAGSFARTWPERDRCDAFFAAVLRRA